MHSEARMAAIGGSRQLIADDQFEALVAVLVDCKAVPRNVMAGVLAGIADGLIAKARGELDTEFALYPAELFDRARALSHAAGRLRDA